LLEEVRYVSNLKRNLISLVEFEKKGYVFKGEKWVSNVIMEFMVVMKGVREYGLCVLESVVIYCSAFIGEQIVLSKTHLWHKI